MFSKESRYLNLGNIVTTDARGRSLESRRLRPPVEVEGSFRHTLEESERLDHLAFKYYRKSQKWWRICDADLAFKSPLALTGKEPVVRTGFTVSYQTGEGSDAPWYRLLETLKGLTGTADVMLTEELQLVPEEREYKDELVTVRAEQYISVITVTHNTLNIDAVELAAAIQTEGFNVDETKPVGRVGKQIVIPPGA
ncbi:MAG: hypothetical protein GY940_16330 [bacterium]|nr:hypothetical protein [bacterium]